MTVWHTREEQGTRGGDKRLFLRLAGNNLRVDNTRNPCNLAATLTPPAIECVAGFHTLSLSARTCSRGSGAQVFRRIIGDIIPPDPLLLLYHRQTLIDVIFTRVSAFVTCDACLFYTFPRISSTSLSTWATYTLGSFFEQEVRNTPFLVLQREIVKGLSIEIINYSNLYFASKRQQMMFKEQSELRLYFSMNYVQFLGKIVRVKKNKSIIPFLSFKNLRTRSVEEQAVQPSHVW